MLGVWHLGGDGNWPDVVGYAGVCDGREAFFANSNPAPLRLLPYELLQASTLQLCYSPSKCELALASGRLRAQAGPAHRGLQ